MRFILGLLLGYCIRGQKAIVLSRSPSVIAIFCFIVRPAIALRIVFLSLAYLLARQSPLAVAVNCVWMRLSEGYLNAA